MYGSKPANNIIKKGRVKMSELSESNLSIKVRATAVQY
jgi:hypothetical protein